MFEAVLVAAFSDRVRVVVVVRARRAVLRRQLPEGGVLRRFRYLGVSRESFCERRAQLGQEIVYFSDWLSGQFKPTYKLVAKDFQIMVLKLPGYFINNFITIAQLVIHSQ